MNVSDRETITHQGVDFVIFGREEFLESIMRSMVPQFIIDDCKTIPIFDHEGARSWTEILQNVH